LTLLRFHEFLSAWAALSIYHAAGFCTFVHPTTPPLLSPVYPPAPLPFPHGPVQTAEAKQQRISRPCANAPTVLAPPHSSKAHRFKIGDMRGSRGGASRRKGRRSPWCLSACEATFMTRGYSTNRTALTVVRPFLFVGARAALHRAFGCARLRKFVVVGEWRTTKY